MDPIFSQLAILLVMATGGAMLARLFRQPIIPFYILVGFLIGPSLAGWIYDVGLIKSLAEVGIAFLLFVVGMELDIRKLKSIGKVASVTGTAQVTLIGLIGYILALLASFEHAEAIYIALIVAFSSTLVVVKMLSDQKEVDTLHGRLILGILLIQDVFAILALPLVETIGVGFGFAPIAAAFAKAGLLFTLSFIGAHVIIPQLFRFAARSTELLLLLSVTTVFVFAGFSLMLGFSVAIGGFLAGLTLGNLPFHHEISARVKPIRDFFATLFFVSLGMEFVPTGLGVIIFPLVLILLIVLIVKPILTMFIVHYFGYAHRTSFITSVSLAQISEFSLIIVAHGLVLGHVSSKLFSITILVAIITIALSSYIIKYDNKLFNFTVPFIKKFGVMRHEHHSVKRKKYDAILVGCDRIGHSILNSLLAAKKKVLVVDFNPDIVARLKKQKIHAIYGDAGDPDFMAELPLSNINMFVCTNPDYDVNSMLVQKVKLKNSNARFFATSATNQDALRLYDEGVDYVILPHNLGGSHASFVIEEAHKNMKKLLKRKDAHLFELKDSL